MSNSLAAILLCAGEGTRMNDNRTHKVCYEIVGIPTIIRLIRNFREAGVERFIVVVGSKSDKVMKCLDGEPGVTFAYQPYQNGTGNASIYGLRVANDFLSSTDAIIAMGDKIIAPEVIKNLISLHRQNSGHITFAVQPKEFNQSGGRIAIKNNKVCGIYEMMDSCLLSLGTLQSQDITSITNAVQKMPLAEKKRKKLISSASKIAGSIPSSVTLNGESFTYAELESSKYVNTATYIVNVKDMLSSLTTLNSDNAQNEIYITDAVNKLIDKYGADISVIEEQSKILTYSTMSDLLSLNKYFSDGSQKRNRFPRASEWIDRLNLWDDGIHSQFEKIYGNNPEYIAERRYAYIYILKSFISTYGDKEVVITRAPGRVNLLGRHIEHRGGSINVMSINRETLLVSSPRNDDVIRIANSDNNFKKHQFSIVETVQSTETNEWVNFIESESIAQMVLNTKGEWVNYVKAAILRLQLFRREKLLSGMDMMFAGNIPIAAGLSSSSSIVVATTEAAIAVNDLDIRTTDFITLCGEGEWFVGSRGGAGDHAAMKCAKRDMITHIEFCPFNVGKSFDFSKSYCVVVANSFVEAKKSAGAKDLFNQKVACYEFGFMMIKKLFPEYSDKLNYLKDINPKTLNVPQSKIYEMLLKLPITATSEEIFKALPEFTEEIKRIQKTHKVPAFYEIRGAILYGISECARAEICTGLLNDGDYESLGNLMNISHNGDRVMYNGEKYESDVSDEYLMKLILDLKSEDIEKVESAQLYNQPGGYACSTPTIDRMIDFVNSQPGVIGSELSGAGLGGCILILVENDKAKDLINALKDFYYDPNALPLGADIFIPVGGSCKLD